MIIEGLDNYRIILASRSPRRQQLLRELGLDFDIVMKDYDESFPPGLNGEEIARHVAHEKAISFRNEIQEDEIVIAADTIVWCNNQVLGKPADRNDAIRMIREISGTTHEVITGVSLLSYNKEKLFTVSTRVTFDVLTDPEIEYYTDKWRPFDKAGAYGIQEWIGLAGCSRIEGSYFNVVGLPVHTLYIELRKLISELSV